MRRTALVLVLCSVIAGSVVSADAASTTTKTYIVVLKDGASPSASLTKRNLTPTHIYRNALLGYSVDLTETEATSLRAAAEVESVTLSGTTSIGPTPEAKKTNPPPPQPAQTVEKAIRRVGGLDSPTAKIDGVDDPMPIDIAIVDTGSDPTHPDLHVAGGVDCGPGLGFSDVNGHGTLVAGLAAAVDNGIGVVGVAPGADVWSVRVGDKHGSVRDADLICGLDWVTARAGTMDVANISLVGDSMDTGNCGIAPSKKDADPVHQAVCALVDAGVTVAVAAGNDSQDASLAYPASYDEVITVSAMSDSDGQPGGLGGQVSCPPIPDTGADDTFASFSNFGADVDIAAPGSCDRATYRGSLYATSSGTSFSSPIVAGAAALYLVNHPAASPADVKAALLAAAEPGPIPGDPDTYPEGIVNVSSL